MPSTFQRRILHHGPDPNGTPVLLAGRTVKGCWFELLRQGGCGSAELELADRFDAPHDIFPGDWLSFEYSPGDRWYLGRVEEIESRLPAGRRLRLEGMSIELNEIFPGGFGESADGAKPHRYAVTDLFTHDPDRSLETADSVDTPDALLRLLLNQYVATGSHIHVDDANIDTVGTPGALVSMKFHGEETVRSIIKDLAVRAGGVSWGVDQRGEFFFLLPRTEAIATFQQGREITSLTQQTTREQLFNRILLTGDYVYDRRDYSGTVARRSFRWRANFVQPESRTQFGERRIRIWLPWIRTQQDAKAFARQFFRTYSTAQSTYLVETLPQESVPFPWLGVITLLDQNGLEFARGQVETLRVNFDHAPSFRMEIGPSDPRQLWPEPPHDERWELPDERQQNGGDVSLSQLSLDGGGGTSQTSLSIPTSQVSSEIFLSSYNSLNSSPGSSLVNSLDSSNSFIISDWSDTSEQFGSTGGSSAINTSFNDSWNYSSSASPNSSAGSASQEYSSGPTGTSSSPASSAANSQDNSSQILVSEAGSSSTDTLVSSAIPGSFPVSSLNSVPGTTLSGWISSGFDSFNTGESSGAYHSAGGSGQTTSSTFAGTSTWWSSDPTTVTSSTMPGS